jgi:hypothetical protein
VHNKALVSDLSGIKDYSSFLNNWLTPSKFHPDVMFVLQCSKTTVSIRFDTFRGILVSDVAF